MNPRPLHRVLHRKLDLNTMTGRCEKSGNITRVWADDLQFSYQDNTRLTGAFELRLDRAGDDYGPSGAASRRECWEFVPKKW